MVQDFYDWKLGSEFNHPKFGKDGKNKDRQGRITDCYHVHLLSDSNSKTSNSYLFYANGGRFGYLLIAVVTDIAHETWKSNAPFINLVNKIASDFCFDGSLPEKKSKNQNPTIIRKNKKIS